MRKLKLNKSFHDLNQNSPSTSEVRSVTLAAFLLPAGSVIPILSSLSRSIRPPFFDFALKKEIMRIKD